MRDEDEGGLGAAGRMLGSGGGRGCGRGESCMFSLTRDVTSDMASSILVPRLYIDLGNVPCAMPSPAVLSAIRPPTRLSKD